MQAHSTSIARRAALRLFAGVGAALLLPSRRATAACPSLIGSIVPPGPAAQLAARLEACCGGRDRVEDIFAAELAALRRLCAATGSSTGLAAELRQAVRADFAAGRVFLLDGWVLARTELALSYLAAAEGRAPA